MSNSTASTPTSNAIVARADNKNSSVTVAKLNEITRVSRKQPVNVLDEDTFIKKLETIIEKDFFPDLEKLKLQQAYYEAVKTNDYEAIRELHSKYNNLLNRSNKSDIRLQTPSTFFGTPSNIVQSKKDKSKKEEPYANEEPPKEPESISLDKFLAQNTSEDNISFDTIMNEAHKKEKTKIHNSWLFDKEKIHSIKYEQSLMLEDGSKREANNDVTKSLDTWTYTSKNSLMYVPEGVPLSSEELIEKSKSTRIINHSNTRFNPELMHRQSGSKAKSDDQQATVNNYPSMMTSQVNVITKIGIDGKETQTRETPNVRGYKFVEPSPSPMPGRLAGDESPMMIWGEIESTPFRLDASATPTPYRGGGGPEFKIPDIPERERIAFNLEEKASAARRKKKNEALKMVQKSLASPSSSARNSPSLSLTEKFNNMSPAAQRLLSYKLNIKSSITTPSSTSSSKQQSHTPSPLFQSAKSATSASPYSLNASSLVKSNLIRSNLKRTSTTPTDSLTDNLLKLPKAT